MSWWLCLLLIAVHLLYTAMETERTHHPELMLTSHMCYITAEDGKDVFSALDKSVMNDACSGKLD